jgi:succinyl-CoA synthetase beta subunit
LVVSSRGGTGIEEIAAKYPNEVERMNIDVLNGLVKEHVDKMIEGLQVKPEFVPPLSKMAHDLYRTFEKYDLRSIEANPIVMTNAGKMVAADCHAVIDDSSVFRHPELGIAYPRDIGRHPTELEKVAWQIEKEDFRGTGYFVQMSKEIKPKEGYVGFHGIGGGGAMLGADALIRHGLKIADFADTSGNPTASKVYRIVKLIFSQPNIEGYILMGAVVANQDQWHHANALVRALREELAHRPGFPVVLLIAGNKEKESLEILKEGLKGTPAHVEIYGRDYVYNVDYVAERMKTLVEDYRKAQKKGDA